MTLFHKFLNFPSLMSKNPNFSKEDIGQLYDLFQSYQPQNGVVNSSIIVNHFADFDENNEPQKYFY